MLLRWCWAKQPVNPLFRSNPSLLPPGCSYPYNLDFDYGPLEGLQKYCINNLGALLSSGWAAAGRVALSLAYCVVMWLPLLAWLHVSAAPLLLVAGST